MPEDRIRLGFVVAFFGFIVLSGVQTDAQVNVTQEHNNASRDGVYIDAAFTPSAAANLTRDLNFNGTCKATSACTVTTEILARLCTQAAAQMS